MNIPQPPTEEKPSPLSRWLTVLRSILVKQFDRTATSATTGASGTLPAQVAGYTIIQVNGKDQAVPYYEV